MRLIRRALGLAAVAVTIGASGLIGGGSAAALDSSANRSESDVPSYVSGYQPDRAGPSDDVGIAYTCYEFWAWSGHTDRVRWYHCHGYHGFYNARRVHICGVSGYLHGVTVFLYPGGADVVDHAHDNGGEGC